MRITPYYVDLVIVRFYFFVVGCSNAIVNIIISLLSVRSTECYSNNNNNGTYYYYCVIRKRVYYKLPINYFVIAAARPRGETRDFPRDLYRTGSTQF